MRTASNARIRARAAADEKADTVIGKWLLGIGARRSGFYKYELDTPLGLLCITPYGTWITCRFDDVDRAMTIMQQQNVLGACPFNRHSGKWNMHFFGEPAPEDMLVHFQAELEWLFRKCGETRDWFVGPLPATIDEKPDSDMTMAEHAEAWQRERGQTVPARNSPEWRKMYEDWHAFAFAGLSQ